MQRKMASSWPMAPKERFPQIQSLTIFTATRHSQTPPIFCYDAAESAGISVTLNTLGNSQIPIGLVTDTAGLGDGVSVTS